MEAVGIVTGLLTIPMVLLTVGSLIGGLTLLATGHWQPVLGGAVAFVACSVLAPVLERIVIATDDAAAKASQHDRTGVARRFAVTSGALPLLILFTAEILSADVVLDRQHSIAAWLWSYGIATGPWTLFALRVSRFRRTLVGLRACAGHIGLWLFAALVFAGAPLPLAATAMALPAVLPFGVGVLLALADREAIRNVRV